MSDAVDDLLRTLEKLREEEYPSIPEELVQEIVEIENDFVEDRNEAQRRIDDLVDSYLSGDE